MGIDLVIGDWRVFEEAAELVLRGAGAVLEAERETFASAEGHGPAQGLDGDGAAVE